MVKIKTVTSNNATETLDQIADAGFRFSVLEKHFKDLSGDRRKALIDYCEENNDGFEMTAKTIDCSNGKVTLSDRSNYTVDVDAIQEMIDSGEVALATILQCCSFRAKDLQTALGSKFVEVAENNPTQSFSFKPSAGFKASVLSELDDETVVEVKPKATKKPAKKVAKAAKTLTVDESIALAEQAEKDNAAKGDSVQADIDSMLGVK